MEKIKEIENEVISLYVKLGLLSVLVIYAFQIIRPFIEVILWAIIIAVAFTPLINLLESKFKIKRLYSVSILSLLLVTLVLLPVYMFAESSLEHLSTISTELKENKHILPSPSHKVLEIPLVGNYLYELWNSAYLNFEATLNKLLPHLKDAAATVAETAGSIFLSALMFIFAFIISAVFMAHPKKSKKASQLISNALFGNNADSIVATTVGTIKSVMYGVMGIAMFQAILTAIGMIAMDIPMVGLVSFAVLILSIIHIPILLVTLPLAVYSFSVSSNLEAILFTIYLLFISVVDNFLLPLILGRGTNIPMIVILIGALGGALLTGFIGLFVGSIVLAVVYSLIVLWIQKDLKKVESTSS